MLSGKFRRGQPLPAGSRGETGYGPKVFSDENLALAESWSEFAAARGHTLLELAFAWLLSKSAVASVIAGATTPEQVRQNAAAAVWRLSESDLAALPTPGSSFATPGI